MAVGLIIGEALAGLVHRIEHGAQHGGLVGAAGLVDERVDLDAGAALEEADDLERDDDDDGGNGGGGQQACATGHADGGDDEDAGGAGESADAVAIVNDEARAEEADALDDVRRDAPLSGLPSPARTAESSVKKAQPMQMSRLVRTPAARRLASSPRGRRGRRARRLRAVRVMAPLTTTTC